LLQTLKSQAYDKIAKGKYSTASYHLGCYVFHFYAGDVAQNILAIAGIIILFVIICTKLGIS
jgi:hypothetical protein